jgi:hypothetical protein
MKIVPVNNLGQYGLIADMQPHELPLNAWSGGRNIRFRDNYVEKFLGHSEVFATPSWAPYWLLPVANSAGTFHWLYASLTKVGATDMSSHADITRAAGDYTGTEDFGWVGDVFNGIPVMTNGFDTPQVWNPVSLAQPLVDLPNWPANYLCRSIRAFKTFLIALDVTNGLGVRNPRLVKWSHPADVGSVPPSWDETDPTLDAGEIEIAETADNVVDAFSLRDIKLIYKEYSTYGMQYIGGVNIFRTYKIFDSFGAFTKRCAAEFFNGKHIVFTGDDVVLHDGQQANSLLKGRLRRYLNGVVSSTAYLRSFVAVNFPMFEVWVCFPETGYDRPNKALVWNWKEDKWGIRDLPLAAFITSGIVNPIGAADLWSGDTNPWSSDSTTWGDRNYQPAQRKMIMAVPSDTKLMSLDDTQQEDGSNMTSYVERTGLGLPLKAELPPDFTTMKEITRLWPRLEGTDGGVVNVYVGIQEKIDGPVTYGPAMPFTIGTTLFVEPMQTARLHALKFESDSNVDWRLHGYDAEVVQRGGH